MYRSILILLLLLQIPVSMSAEKALSVQSIEGAEKQCAISLIGYITFASEQMVLYSKSGELLGYTRITDIGRIAFNESCATAIDNIPSNVCVYPIPAKDILVISGLEKNQSIHVYDLQGKLQNVQPVAGNMGASTTINVSGLGNGIYLLQIGAEVVKFIKQ